MNVVLYLRFSSERQNEQSIEGQRRVCTEYCKRMGYDIVDEYVDRALSASKNVEKRVAFQQMIKDSKTRNWELVIVYKLDRFARARKDSAIYKSKLLKNGVRVVSATESISDSPEGIILESVLEGMAEFYSAELSQKVTRGMKESALKCNSTGGILPLGYKIENKKYVVDEANAKIVQEAFGLYASGVSINEICEIFNKKGYRSTKGAEFNKNSFNRMFKNEKYIGVYKYKDIRIEDGMPAIIDKDLFNSVQKKLNQNKKAPARNKAKVRYFLTQKLFCGHCGEMMVGESGRSKTGRIYHYYTCKSRKSGDGCDKKPVSKEWIEKIVAADAVKKLTPENIEIIAEAAVKQSQKELSENVLISSLQQELDDTNKKISNLIKFVENGADSQTLTERISELEDEKRRLSDRLNSAMSEVIVLDKELVTDFLSLFVNGDVENEEFRRKVINLLVNSVTIWDDPDGYLKFTYLYNLTGKNTETIRVKNPKNKGSDIDLDCSPYQKAVPRNCLLIW